MRPDQPRPFVTFTRALNPDPQLRAWHAETSRWDGTQWLTTLVVRDLVENPWAVAAARQETGVEHDLVHAWRDFGDGRIEWQPMDPATGAMIGVEDFFAAPYRGYPPGLAMRSDDNPAFTFFDDPPGAPGMYYARWGGGGLVDNTLLPQCADEHAPLQLRTDDRFVTTCTTDAVAGAGRDVRLLYQDNSLIVQNEVVFGDADPDVWIEPDVAIAGDTVVVAAFNFTKREVWTRVKVGAQPWQAPTRLLDLAPFGPGIELSVDARQHADGLLHAIILRDGGDAIWYAEDRPIGPQPDPTRVDLYDEGTTGVCGLLLNNPDVVLPDDDSAWLNWQQERAQITTSRFTAFRRQDQRRFANDPLKARPHEPTTLSVAPDGDGWQCFFNEDPAGAPKIALFLQQRDNIPLLVDADTGVTPGAYGRGCDVSVDDDGRVHVVWSNAKLDRLRSRFFEPGVGFSAIHNLFDQHGAVPATSYVALAASGTRETSTVYQRPVGAFDQACVQDTVNQANFAITCFADLNAGAYPDITVRSDDGTERALVFDGDGEVRVAKTSAFPGGWADEVVINEIGYDFSIAGRVDGPNRKLFVAWARFGGTPAIRLAEQADPGPWAVIDLETGPAELVNIVVNPLVEPVLTWKRLGSQSGTSSITIRLATNERFAAGRVGPVPTPAFVFCDLADVTQSGGNALDVDVHGNPRVTYRTGSAFGGPVSEHSIQYISRP